MMTHIRGRKIVRINVKQVHGHRGLVGFCLAVLLATGSLIVAEDAAVVAPFNGKNQEGWVHRPHKKNSNQWVVGTAAPNTDDPRQFDVDATRGDQLINARGQGVDIYSEYEYGDAIIELEVMVPKGANSGIYVHGEYEIQVLDSFGVEKPGPGDMGAIYGASPPRNPKYLPPGAWQTFQIVFRAPRFDELGRKVANAVLQKVVLNGQVIHENVELKGPTPGGLTGKEEPKGPLMFQGDHGPVAFRQIRITPLK